MVDHDPSDLSRAGWYQVGADGAEPIEDRPEVPGAEGHGVVLVDEMAPAEAALELQLVVHDGVCIKPAPQRFHGQLVRAAREDFLRPPRQPPKIWLHEHR